MQHCAGLIFRVSMSAESESLTNANLNQNLNQIPCTITCTSLEAVMSSKSCAAGYGARDLEAAVDDALSPDDVYGVDSEVDDGDDGYDAEAIS
jgi:hypothetical protein